MSVPQFACEVPLNGELIVGGGRGPQSGLCVDLEPFPQPGEQRVLAGPDVVALLDREDDLLQLLADLLPGLTVYAPFLPLEGVRPFP